MKERTKTLLLSVMFMIGAAILGGFFTLLLSPLWTESPSSLSEEEKADPLPLEEENGVAAAKRILPSVVGIRATERSTENGLSSVNESSGSGVIIDARGYIVTNHHVIGDATEISVVFHDDSEVKAEVIGSDSRTDLALLKAEKEGITAASFRETELQVGQTAYAVGNPGGTEFAGTVTRGIISGLDRTLSTDDGASFLLIQTDAAINPGNSGGALCDKNGEVVGINVLKIAQAGFEGMGFAIPASTVKEIAAELLEFGSISRGKLGVYLLVDVTEGIAQSYGTNIDYGVLIGLQEDSAAGRAGIRDYDIITAIDGETVRTMAELQQKIYATDPGDTVTVTVWREDTFINYPVTLDPLEETE